MRRIHGYQVQPSFSFPIHEYVNATSPSPDGLRVNNLNRELLTKSYYKPYVNPDEERRSMNYTWASNLISSFS